MNENEEIWKDIEGYENYQVSNLGRVKSLRDNHGNSREKILKFGKNRYGYLQVKLYKNEKEKTCKVHRLVANAFIENPNNFPMINHKDEDKTNNIVSNLEWCDAKYNNNYGTAIQRRVASTDYKAIAAKIDYKAKVANTDYKSFQQKRVANTDYKAFQQKRVANTDYKAIAEKTSKQVYQYSLDLKLIKIWNSTAECDRNGYSSGNVSKCCRGERKTHKGFIWSYKELKKIIKYVN